MSKPAYPSDRAAAAPDPAQRTTRAAPGGPLQNPRRILVVRLSAIGDLVMASPLIGALRRTLPGAHIAWLVQSEAAALIDADPRLDEVIAWPRAQWRALWVRGRWRALAAETIAFVRALRRRHFEVVIDLQGLLKSAVWARLSGAPTRIGLNPREGSAWLLTRAVHAPHGDKRIGSEYRYLAQVLELEHKGFAMELRIRPQDEAGAARLRREAGLSGPYAAACPFTTRPQKHWPEARWAALSRGIRSRFALPTVLLGGPEHEVAAQRIARDANGALASLAGRTTLAEAAALVKGAALVAGVDTGLTHMGVAFGVPTVALFGSTCPYLDTGTRRATVLYKRLQCSPCRRRPTCGGAHTCMALLTVDEVLAAAAQVLAEAT